MKTAFKMKGMDFGNSPLKQDVKISTGFGKEADENLSKKVNKSGSKSTRSFTKTAEAKKFLKANTVKQKPFVKPKGVFGPGTRPLSPKVKKDISKVKNVAKGIGKKTVKFLSSKFMGTLGMMGTGTLSLGATPTDKQKGVNKTKKVNFNAVNKDLAKSMYKPLSKKK
tara:strand:- start:547 stop:1047 length:501 start_codon:yes stop_codon:yes gene_type:complete